MVLLLRIHYKEDENVFTVFSMQNAAFRCVVSPKVKLYLEFTLTLL